MHALLEEHKRFAVMIKKMSKNKVGSQADMKNPQEMMKKLQSSIDPKLM